MTAIKEIQYDVDTANNVLKYLEHLKEYKFKCEGVFKYADYQDAYELLISKNLVKKDDVEYTSTDFASEMCKNGIVLTMSDFRKEKGDSGIAELKAKVANDILEKDLGTSDHLPYNNQTIKITAKELTDMGILEKGTLTNYAIKMKGDGGQFKAADFTNVVYADDEMKEYNFGSVNL
ncbi:MAG: hypothetical protein IJ911_09700 [Salinivirgaceae bacterium]|nr:hypothetical protein [Salinivirgaceae bacterium]